MNASQLLAGDLYAWKRKPPKGRIPTDAKKVRLRHTEQRKASYMQNRHTVAAITVVETGEEFTVPAREIIAFWDEYEGERDAVLEERRQIEMKQRRIQLRRTVMEAMINYRLNERQLPFVVSLPYESTAQIPTSALMSYLDISEEQVTEAIERAMEKEYGEEKV